MCEFIFVKIVSSDYDLKFSLKLRTIIANYVLNIILNVQMRTQLNKINPPWPITGQRKERRGLCCSLMEILQTRHVDDRFVHYWTIWSGHNTRWRSTLSQYINQRRTTLNPEAYKRSEHVKTTKNMYMFWKLWNSLSRMNVLFLIL